MATLRFNPRALSTLREQRQLTSDRQLAEALHVNPGTISRVLAGKAAPGPHLIASALQAFPVTFEDLFVVVSDATPAATP